MVNPQSKKDSQIKKPFVLLCFHSERLQNHLFYCVFAPQKIKVLKNQWFYCVFANKIEFDGCFIAFCLKIHYKTWLRVVFLLTSCIFSENPCAKMQKTQKQKCLKTNVCFLFFQRKKHRMLKTVTKF